jgi:signal transduction histidine kinase/DNA-binding response OmpR family regulator
VTVTLRDGGDHAELEVRDTGIGVPAAALPHLFERFHRIETPLARTHEGTGIGLALAHELIKLHGGNIRVESAEGRGTTFTVSIPFGKGHLPPEQLRAPLQRATIGANAYVEEALRWLPVGVSPPGAGAPLAALPLDLDESIARLSAPRRSRVLLADDNADMRDYVRRLLSAYWDVEVVADGQAALASIARQPPDIVLTDVMMPRLDGMQLLTAIRASAAHRHLPVMLLSARAGDDARIEGLQAGADDYLVKPFGGPELIARVGAALKLAGVRREGEDRLSAVNRDLRHRVAELETLLSVIPVGIGIAFDRECRNIQINAAFASTLGLTAGANASMTAPDGQRPTAFKVLDTSGAEVPGDRLPMQTAAREGRELRDVEFDIVHSNGRVVRLLEYAAPLFDEKGEPRGAVGAFVDITERRRVEVRDRLLLQIDDMLRGATDPAVLLRSVAHSIGEHVQASRCFFAEVAAEHAHLSVEGDYRRDPRAPSIAGTHPVPESPQVTEDLRAGRPIVIEDVLRDSRGTAAALAVIPDRTAGSIVTVPIHRTRRWISNLVVTTSEARAWHKDELALLGTVAARSGLAAERLRLNVALRRSNERARLALEIARIGAWSWDPVRDIVIADKRTREICLLDPDEPLTLPRVVTHMHPDDWPAVETALQDSMSAGSDGRFSVEARFTNAGGTTRWILAHGQMQFSSDEGTDRRPVLLLGSVIDITDRVQTEADLRSTNRMKDEFLATLSHELRTPLNAVLGWAHMLRTGSLREDVARRAFESLERNARAQAKLVDDLLDVPRIISGKLQMRSEDVPLHVVISNAIETIQPTAISRQVTLQVRADPGDTLLVSGDVDRLRQVVWNLLSNAVKFTPAGGLVEILMRRDGDHAEIVVRDTGQGIESSFLPFVFDRFRQADGTTTRKHGGLGLGLAIVRHLTEAHGGTVEASSDGLDRGAAFTIRLPLANRETRIAAAVSSGNGDGGPLLLGARILVVDDEPDSRDLFRAILESHGAHVDTVESVGAAVHALGNGTHDVILADISMPREDGYALIRAVRAFDGASSQVPAIAVTAYANPADRSMALDAGFNWHLAKPVEPDMLVETVKKAIDS